MKRLIIKSVLLSFMLIMFGGVGVRAQINLGNILGSVLGGDESSSSSSSSGSDIISNLTAIFSGDKQATKNQIVGTWVYTEPAIVFESENFLAKAGASLAADKIESKLQEYLTKYGITPGAFSIDFAEDGTFAETINGKTMSGQWAIEDSNLVLTYGTIKPVSITTQVEGTKLLIVTDATQLLNFMKTLGSQSTNTSISTITTLMKSVNGMKAGLTLVKK